MLGIRHYQGVALDLFQGDITQFACDVMVNAANPQLAGGGGVDGAIHRAGGPTILAECQRIVEGCPTGSAVVTTAGKLPCSKLIHTVGPQWSGGNAGEVDLLGKAYRSSLNLANDLKVRHVAFPSISTGVYGYPVAEAAKVAFRSQLTFIEEAGKQSSIRRITMVLFSGEDYRIYQTALEDLLPEGG